MTIKKAIFSIQSKPIMKKAEQQKFTKIVSFEEEKEMKMTIKQAIFSIQEKPININSLSPEMNENLIKKIKEENDDRKTIF